MTIGALKSISKFKALLDSNYTSNNLLSPKSRLPIVGKEDWIKFNDAYCIVFSFGYYNEIKESLLKVGFDEDKIISLLDFYPQE